MSKDKEIHPIRRIRDALAQLPEGSRMAEVKNFSRWVGCSESLIRNVENNKAELSEKLAKSIEDKTGVSAEWLLSSSNPEEPIIDRRGRPWTPGRSSPFCYLPNLDRLLAACATLVPGIVAKLVEAQMLAELHNGKIEMLETILNFLDRHDFFEESERGDHPFRWLAEDETREALKGIGIKLLMNRASELTAEQVRDLEYLRVMQTLGLPEGSRLLEIYKEMEARRLQLRQEIIEDPPRLAT